MAKIKDRFGTELETIGLRAPTGWFERLDTWRNQQDYTPPPSRPAAIRWIVDQFLAKQEQRRQRREPRPKPALKELPPKAAAAARELDRKKWYSQRLSR
jgi:hypothetical protein